MTPAGVDAARRDRRGVCSSTSRIGVDSYAYHRLLGETRPGEDAPAGLFARGALDVIVEARACGLDFVLLQTCLLGNPAAFAPEEHVNEAGPLALGLSWGAPNGFAFGDRPDALEGLLVWLDHAAALDLPVMRIVAGGPGDRGRPLSPLTGLLREACAAAGDLGLRLALENHGDLTADQLESLLELVAEDSLRVCFDTANALRVGDDVAASARRLAPAIEIVHVKDCLGRWDDRAAGPISVPPGEGVIPLDEVLEACPEALACIELGQLPSPTDEIVLVRHYADWLRSR